MEMNNSLRLGKDEVGARLASGAPYVIRLKVPDNQQITFTDLIRGSVTFHSDQVDDKVLLKSDGMPTYHLAHIVDDVLMEITHAVRGEEWLPSAPAHILIYRFLGWENKMPLYAHLPLLLKPDGNGKLSKRDGDRLGFPVFPLNWTDPVTGEVSSGYREKGYYPEAFVNMLALLGWNPGTEQELFTMDELITAFSFEHVHKAGARFDPEKAKWFNEQYLRRKPIHESASRVAPWLQAAFDLDETDKRIQPAYVDKAVALLRDRVQFEQEMVQKGKYLFVAPVSYDETVIAKKWKTELLPFFGTLVSSFSGINEFTGASADVAIKLTCTAHQVKPGEIMQLLRVFVSGEGAGVDLLGMLELLGREEVVTRLQTALKQLT
jgi:glutamyl-tRNA synthetase